MADSVNIKYTHPVNYQNNFPALGDKAKGYGRYVVELSGSSDGTGEELVKKIELANLRTVSGDPCTAVHVECIRYEISNMLVDLFWDRSPQGKIVTLGGLNGCVFGEVSDAKYDDGDVNSGSGDILLSTRGHMPLSHYSITLILLAR